MQVCLLSRDLVTQMILGVFEFSRLTCLSFEFFFHKFSNISSLPRSYHLIQPEFGIEFVYLIDTWCCNMSLWIFENFMSFISSKLKKNDLYSKAIVCFSQNFGYKFVPFVGTWCHIVLKILILIVFGLGKINKNLSVHTKIVMFTKVVVWLV